MGIIMVMEAWKNDDIKGGELFEDFIEMIPPAVLFYYNAWAH